MAVCAVIDQTTNAQVNTIVADPTDAAPEGYYLVEIPAGYYWNGTQVVPVPIEEITDGN